jgi:hypothetical protein
VARVTRIRTLWLNQRTAFEFEFRTAMRLGREDPAWLRTYLGLQKVVQAKDSSEALAARTWVDWTLLRSPEIPAAVRNAAGAAKHRLKSLGLEGSVPPFETPARASCIASGILFRLLW